MVVDFFFLSMSLSLTLSLSLSLSVSSSSSLVFLVFDIFLRVFSCFLVSVLFSLFSLGAPRTARVGTTAPLQRKGEAEERNGQLRFQEGDDAAQLGGEEWSPA